MDGEREMDGKRQMEMERENRQMETAIFGDREKDRRMDENRLTEMKKWVERAGQMTERQRQMAIDGQSYMDGQMIRQMETERDMYAYRWIEGQIDILRQGKYVETERHDGDR